MQLHTIAATRSRYINVTGSENNLISQYISSTYSYRFK